MGHGRVGGGQPIIKLLGLKCLLKTCDAVFGFLVI